MLFVHLFKICWSNLCRLSVATFALLLALYEMMGTHGLMVTVGPTSLHCALLKKTYCLKLSYIHDDITIRQKCQGWYNLRVNPTISIQTGSCENDLQRESFRRTKMNYQYRAKEE